MRRHDLDWVSLVAGAVFTLIGLLYLVVGVTDVDVDGRFVWPVLLVALGAAGVATAVRATQRDERQLAAAPVEEEQPPA